MFGIYQYSNKVSLMTRWLLSGLLISLLCACGGDDKKLPKELKEAIETIQSMDEVQTEIEKDDRSRAIGAFLKFAKKGNVEAMYWVAEGRLLERKEENYVSVTETIRWLEKAAEAGHAKASQELGLIYGTEEEVKNSEQAYMWYYIGYYIRDGKIHEFSENNDQPVTGDFRNETMVAPLVKELGSKKIKLVEEKAKAWLAKNYKR